MGSSTVRSPRQNLVRGAVTAAGVTAAVFALGACSSNSNSSSSASPTSSVSSSSATHSSSSATCTTESIANAIPNGAQIQSFNCTGTGGGEIAAVRFNPGSTVLFLKLVGGKWEPINADQVCGTASAGLDPKVLAYCTTPSPTKSKSKSASPSQSLLQ